MFSNMSLNKQKKLEEGGLLKKVIMVETSLIKLDHKNMSRS